MKTIEAAPNQQSISIVCAIYDEEKSLELLHEKLTLVCTESNYNYEIIFVDDGSCDNSGQLIADIAARDSRVHALHLQRNFGQTAAMAAGIDHSSYPIIITMDADLQNDPADIPALLHKLADGYDVVSGWRRNRQDKLWSRRVPSIIANSIIGRVTGIRLHDYGCSLKAYRASVLKQVRLYGELHRFVPALCAAVGARVTEVPVSHHPRVTGRSKYGIGRTLRVILDLLTVKFLLTYSTRPMQFFGITAAMTLLGAVTSSIATVVMKFGPQKVDMSGNPLLYLTVLLLVIAAQLLAVGLLAELVMRTYYETQNKSIYVLKKHIGTLRSP